jgi:Xaa-Pro aminopeptidase
MTNNYQHRRQRLAESLVNDKIDVALVTQLVNVQYLTGLDSSNAALLVGADGSALLATDSRYATAAAMTAPELELVVQRQVAPALAAQAARGRSHVSLGIEEHEVTLERLALIKSAFEETGTAYDITHLDRRVERLRTVKDDNELTLLARACAISCQALEDLYAAGRFVGRTEKEIARDLEGRMFEHGADGLAFATIVAAGSNSALPHHQPTDRRVERGDLLMIDFGATCGGYHADCTRTSVVGAEPASWQREVYDVVLAAQTGGCAALSVGADYVTVDQASRTIIDSAGHREHFGHATGHGVGLQAHEVPTLGYSATGTLTDRMTVTVEPGIYLPEHGGVRIEDTLVVRAAGGPELLTLTTKDLLVLDA